MTVQPWEPSGIIAECVNPQPQDVRHALDKKQVLWRWKNSDIQVLAQTLSNYLGTRTSSLLAVNKKQGVPSEFIHHEWKRTWVNLDGLKQRVAQTGHSSELLKGLKQVIQVIDAVTTPDDRAILSSVEQKKQAKPGTKRNPIDVCEVAVDANERAVHNTERLTKLDHRVSDLEQAKDHLGDCVWKLEKWLGRVDKQATQNTVNQTLLGELNTRLGRIATQADSLDSRTDGLESRVSVLEDTSKWLSWTLAGVIGLRFLSLMLRWLRRK